MRIDPVIRNLSGDASKIGMPKDSGGESQGSFVDMLKAKIGEVDQMQHQADETMAASSVKGASNIHETMVRLEEADMGLRLMAKVRNKALDAYHEVMRMQF
jgi:flagellar hook-basal body complex protein FliE